MYFFFFLVDFLFSFRFAIQARKTCCCWLSSLDALSSLFCFSHRRRPRPLLLSWPGTTSSSPLSGLGSPGRRLWYMAVRVTSPFRGGIKKYGSSAVLTVTLLRRRALPANCVLTLYHSREPRDMVASSSGDSDVEDAVVVVTSDGAE